MALPALAGWDVHVTLPAAARRLGSAARPGHPARAAHRRAGRLVGGPLAERLPWGACCSRRTPAGLAWMLSLALVDGQDGIGKILDTKYEYLRTARRPATCPGAPRLGHPDPYDGLPDDIADANWPVHVAGHPPGALSFFVLLDRIGLGAGGRQASSSRCSRPRPPWRCWSRCGPWAPRS